MKIKKSALAVLLIIVIGTVFQNTAMFKSGKFWESENKSGIAYFGPLARDGVWHEALSSELSTSLPPNNPGFSGNRLTNYHYLYDLLVSMFSKIIPMQDLIYRVFPLLFSVLLGIGTYILSMRLFKNKFVSVINVFVAYFASSFGWMVDILKMQKLAGESTFWANQPISMNINPPFAISLVLFIYGLILLDIYLKKPKRLVFVGLTLIAGLLIGFKVYAGIIFLGALLVLTLKRALEKDFRLVPVFLTSTLVSLIIFIPQLSGGSLLTLYPLWLPNSMIDIGDRVGWLKLSQARYVYIAEGRVVKLFAVYIIGLIIFFLGNIGTRFVAFAGFDGGIKRFFKNDLNIFLLAGSAISFVFPMLFVQNGTPWNIVQFFYYFLFFIGLWTGVGVFQIYKTLPKAVSYVFLIIFILITPVSSVATFISQLYPNPPAYLPSGELTALQFLSGKERGVVLKHPYDQKFKEKFSDPYPLLAYADNSYVSAYSGKEVFIEDVEQQIVLNTPYTKRLEEAQRFFVEKDLSWSNQFLTDNGIKYVYLPKVYYLPMAENEYNMKKIFENSEVNVYEVK